MSHGGDLFALGEGVASQPSFDTALRGYDKRQVDRYVESVENDLAGVSAERDQAFLQLQALAGQVQQLQDQLVEAARKAAPSRVSFRHLGSRVEQILSLAEDQAESIVTQAEQSILDRRAEADRILADAKHRASTAAQDFDLALAARRAEERKADEQQRLALEQETQRLRAEARDLLTHTQLEAQAIRTAAAQEAAARRVQADKDITETRTESEQRLAVANQEIAAAVKQAEAQRNAIAQTQSELATFESQLAAARAEAAKAHQQLSGLRQQVAAEAGQLEQLRLAAQQPIETQAVPTVAVTPPAAAPVLPMEPALAAGPAAATEPEASAGPAAATEPEGPAGPAAAAGREGYVTAPASEPATSQPATPSPAAPTGTSPDSEPKSTAGEAAGPMAESGAAESGPAEHDVTVRLSAAGLKDEANQTVRLDIGSRDGAQRYAAPRNEPTSPNVPGRPGDDADKTTELRAG